eukprot:108167_1
MGLLHFIINATIFLKEYKKRKSAESKLTIKSLQILSMLCIIFGVLEGFSNFVIYIYGFCYFAEQIAFVFLALQCLSMGFYQLCRLYYCFSINEAYSNRGYANWLFIIMYLIGILWINAMIIGIWFLINISNYCGVNQHIVYIETNANYRYHPLYGIITGIYAFIYLLWDFMTLSLYIIKVISFRKYKSENIDVYKRIMSILNRILILTIFYQMTSVTLIIMTVIEELYGRTFVVIIFYVGSVHLVSIAMNYSMYLMQNHNTDSYKKFLKFLYNLKLYYICCCCKSIIFYEWETYSDGNNKDTITVQEKQSFVISPLDISTTVTTTNTENGYTGSIISGTKYSGKTSQQHANDIDGM